MYDVIILGGGPAGLCAGIYAKRAMLNCVVVEKIPFGAGQITESERVDNYLGLLGESGFELGNKFRNHAKSLGVEFYTGNAVKIISNDNGYLIVMADKSEISARTIIYALGANRRKLEVSGEQQFTGKGVSYCAVCDGAFYKDKTVVVAGGGDTAVGDAILLSKFAKKVYLVHRRNQLKASNSLQQQLKELNNVSFQLNSSITEIIGDNKVTAVKINTDMGEKLIKTDGVFIAVGTKPMSDLLKDIVQMDDNGYVIADETGVTTAKGIFVAGDVRTKDFRQLITAVADGANCAYSAEKYLENKRATLHVN